MWFEHFEILNKFEKQNKYMLTSFFAINITTIFIENFEKFFNKIDKVSLIEKQLKKKISTKFHKYVKIFNFVETNKFSFKKKWNHNIDLKFETTSSTKKTYDLSRDQIKIIKKYIDDMLSKNFIKFSFFEYATSILMMKKLENDLKMCVDYRIFNVLTIKNKNAFSLIRKTLTKLCSTKIYNKFDIIVAFNEMRIKEKNEKKTTFLTRYDFFEYVIMFFELCNVSRIF